MDPVLLVVGGFGVIVLFVLMSVLATLYKKCGPAEALIISGGFSDPPATGPQVIVGGGTVVIPLLQKVDVLSLDLMSIDLKNMTPLPTADSRGLYFTTVIEACIDKDPTTIIRAAGHFSGKTDKEVRSIIYDIVHDHLRQVVATIKGDNVQAKTDQLANAVLQQAGQDLLSLGIHLRGFRVKEIREVRTHVGGDPAATASYSSLPALMASSGVNFGSIGSNGNKLVIGTIAVVSNTITSDQPGEVTYSLQNGTRSVKTAKTRMPGMKIDIGTAVVIVELDSDAVFVDSWSPIHTHMPALQQ